MRTFYFCVGFIAAVLILVVPRFVSAGNPHPVVLVSQVNAPGGGSMWTVVGQFPTVGECKTLAMEHPDFNGPKCVAPDDLYARVGIFNRRLPN